MLRVGWGTGSERFQVLADLSWLCTWGKAWVPVLINRAAVDGAKQSLPKAVLGRNLLCQTVIQALGGREGCSFTVETSQGLSQAP